MRVVESHGAMPFSREKTDIGPSATPQVQRVRDPTAPNPKQRLHNLHAAAESLFGPPGDQVLFAISLGESLEAAPPLTLERPHPHENAATAARGGASIRAATGASSPGTDSPRATRRAMTLRTMVIVMR